MRFVFIADFFSNEINGGGELNNQYLIESLRERGHNIIEKKSIDVDVNFIEAHSNYNFIIGNFVQLSAVVIKKLQNLSYIIYEHDHKYLKSRNPALYNDYKAPNLAKINESFYKNAKAVYCQSALHSSIVARNINIDNIKNVGGNIWSEEILSLLESLRLVDKKNCFSIMDSPIQHKNTFGAIEYCNSIKQKYNLIKSNDYHQFLKKLSENKKFVFLPKTPETLSRVAVEARMMDVEVHTNSRLGASSEPWFKLKGQELIDFMRQKKEDIVDSVENIFNEENVYWQLKKAKNPKVSIITSLYKGDDHIEEFLKNITSQTIFSDCELIIINANSPGNECSVVKKYMESFSNIIYQKLDYDPGIYGCWNIAIEKSSGEFLTNANLDDCRSKQQIEILLHHLSNNPDVDLVYSECYVTHKPNEKFSENSSQYNVYPVANFSKQAMIKCLPGCMPLWRRSMHKNIGLFNEKLKSAGDWDMWLRSVQNGSKFLKVDGIYGLYYHNPKGLSTNHETQNKKYLEEKSIFWNYTDIFGKSVTDNFKDYFSQ
tara:strand:- start:64615 stop:66243 length:1629 start_codon:yes stop_codon:yes gene_type:complete